MAAPRFAHWRRRLAAAPLFHRLLAAMLVASLVPAVPIFYFTLIYNQQAAIARTEKDLSQQISILVSGFEQEYRIASQRSLKQIAASDALNNFLSGPREERLINAKVLESLFHNIAREHDSYSGLYFIDPDGLQVASVIDRQRAGGFGQSISWRTDGLAAGDQPTVAAGERLFRRISTTPALLSAGNMEWFMPPRDVLFEGPFRDEKGRPSLLVGISTLDADSGSFSGAAIIRLNLEAFIDVLSSVQVFDERLAWLFDTQGVALLSSPSSLGASNPWAVMREATTSVAREVNTLRTPTGLILHRDVEAAEDQVLLKLAFSLPDDLIARDFRDTRNLFLLAMLVSVAAMSAIAYAVSLSLSRPIVQLVEAARDLAQGNLSTRVRPPAGGEIGGEIGVLTQSFNSMADNLERSMKELGEQTTVVDKAPFGILIIDPHLPDSPIKYHNEAFSKLLGYPAIDVIGRHPRFMFGPGVSPAQTAAVEQALRHREPLLAELSTRAEDGRELEMHWTVFPCEASDGTLLSLVVFLDDVSEMRHTEREREQLAAEIQESNKLQFLSLTIAGMAHDLNTPVGVGVTAASQMQRMVQRMADSMAREPGNIEGLKSWMRKIESTSEIIVRNLEKAGQLVQGFKKTSANATRTEWSIVNVANLLESLIVTVSPLMKRARCTVNLNCPPSLRLYTEPGSVSQAITNLLINATLHAFEGREDRQIHLEATSDAEQVHILVIDNGNGMTEEAAIKAFTPFFTTKRASGGSGLGLFSCRRVVEEVLGGKISFESTPGVGTRFHITLPREAAATALKDAPDALDATDAKDKHEA